MLHGPDLSTPGSSLTPAAKAANQTSSLFRFTKPAAGRRHDRHRLAGLKHRLAAAAEVFEATVQPADDGLAEISVPASYKAVRPDGAVG